jgi:hypothetical protein
MSVQLILHSCTACTSNVHLPSVSKKNPFSSCNVSRNECKLKIGYAVVTGAGQMMGLD